MPALLTLPKRPVDDAEVEARVSAVTESWRASLASTEPANRPVAEAAITGLYRNIGLRDPEILWVASPLAAALAYQTIGSEDRHLLSPYAKGDVGTGDNRTFHALRDPFGFPEYVVPAIPERIRQRSSVASQQGLNRARDAAAQINAALRVELRSRIPVAIGIGAEIGPVQTPPDRRLGEFLLGSSAEAFVHLIGEEAFAEVAGLAIRDAFVDRIRSGRHGTTVQAMQGGQFDADVAAWAAIESVFGIPFYVPRRGDRGPRERLALRLQLARTAGPWWALDGLAIVSERPLRMLVDAEGRLHADDGPAIAYGDGFTIHAWHGVVVSRDVIESPEGLTLQAIDNERNAERRRVMVERFGPERMIVDGDAELIHEDATGKLWRRPMPWADRGPGEPIVMIEVLNSTPEPDGSRKTYFLRVPPTMRTARQAVAWTFGLGEAGYQPAVET